MAARLAALRKDCVRNSCTSIANLALKTTQANWKSPVKNGIGSQRQGQQQRGAPGGRVSTQSSPSGAPAASIYPPAVSVGFTYNDWFQEIAHWQSQELFIHAKVQDQEAWQLVSTRSTQVWTGALICSCLLRH